MMSVSLLGLFLFGLAYGQDSCIFTGGPNGSYTLNLTSIQHYTYEFETPQHFYYYTPCGNRLSCPQGNQNFTANAAQFQPGANQCENYLSVDNGSEPTYSFSGATWYFSYSNGELCSSTQQPRRTTIYYHCDEEATHTFLYNVEERQRCNYILNIHSPLACIPPNKLNAQCQWKINAKTGDIYNLDLSSFNGVLINASSTTNGYRSFYTPCANKLDCNHFQPMMEIFNEKTKTCDHINAIWEDGRVQPQINFNSDTYYYSFHYYNGQTCSDGNDDVTHINWWCDPSIDTYKIVNSSEVSDCHYVWNIASSKACNATQFV